VVVEVHGVGITISTEVATLWVLSLPLVRRRPSLELLAQGRRRNDAIAFAGDWLVSYRTLVEAREVGGPEHLLLADGGPPLSADARRMIVPIHRLAVTVSAEVATFWVLRFPHILRRPRLEGLAQLRGRRLALRLRGDTPLLCGALVLAGDAGDTHPWSRDLLPAIRRPLVLLDAGSASRRDQCKTPQRDHDKLLAGVV